MKQNQITTNHIQNNLPVDTTHTDENTLDKDNRDDTVDMTVDDSTSSLTDTKTTTVTKKNTFEHENPKLNKSTQPQYIPPVSEEELTLLGPRLKRELLENPEEYLGTALRIRI